MTDDAEALAELHKIGEIKRLVVPPGGALVLTVPAHTTEERMVYARKLMEEVLPGIRCLIVSADVGLTVIDNADASAIRPQHRG